MESIVLINDLSVTLQQAVVQQDLAQIESLDERITQLLASPAGQGNSQTRALAVMRLKEIYQQAYYYCQQESQRLKAEILRLREEQEGVTAYAAMAISAYQNMAQEERAR
ncbi:hypothetical protein QVN60_03400 [Yersinia aleksiciae]|uniref:hypothetical protein n=1 Tax=Yersinia aleksiciae TaxID=263819 RepID=UPI0025AA8929|nr:hypothetical protein [Yersinia aleksiciae]MDN0122261.1 hypothetical protein [Yersinia aleksiciae]